MVTIVDATGARLGRLSSMLAKRLLEGEVIVVVNSEKAIIVGSKDEIESRYKQKREVGGTKRKGPFFPRMPDMILKRTVRGMLPYQQPKGRKAYKNLKTYIGVPEEFENEKFEKVEAVNPSSYVTLKELSEYLGISW